MAYPGNTARCVFEFTLPNGGKGYVTPHVRTFGGADLTQGDVEDIADLLADWFVNDDFEGETNTALRQFFNDATTLTSITVTSLDPTAPPQKVLAVGSAGANAANPLPLESALVVTLYTGIVGRSYRGRNYWPGLRVDLMQDNGTLVDATVAGLQDTFNALIAGLVTDGNYVLAVHSPTLGAVNQVISCVVRDTVHHQRRRNS